MALIVCKNCGRQISDQAEECIHCGFSILQENAEQECSQAKVEQKTETVDFSDLPKIQQALLEKEFLKTDKKMLKQRRKMQEASSCRKIGVVCYFMMIVYCLLGREYVEKRLEINVYNSDFYYYSTIFAVLFALLSLAWFLKSIFSRRSVKKYVYHKKFQIWLEQNKNISYTPVFMTDKEKSIFENLEKESIKNY